MTLIVSYLANDTAGKAVDHPSGDGELTAHDHVDTVAREVRAGVDFVFDVCEVEPVGRLGSGAACDEAACQ